MREKYCAQPQPVVVGTAKKERKLSGVDRSEMGIRNRVVLVDKRLSFRTSFKDYAADK